MNRADYERLIEPAYLLQLRKSTDYNGEESVHSYFPFGPMSYAQMIHVKSMRIAQLSQNNQEPNFESIRDSLFDLINYTVFYLDFLDRKDKI